MKKENWTSAAIDTMIGEGTFFNGTIKTKGPLRICGQVEGKIESEAEVFIGEKSKIQGDVRGGRVVVSGEISGNIIATDGLEISKSGRVHGNITADRLLMEEGTTYTGKVTVGAVSEEPIQIVVEDTKHQEPKKSSTTQIFNLFSSNSEEERVEAA